MLGGLVKTGLLRSGTSQYKGGSLLPVQPRSVLLPDILDYQSRNLDSQQERQGLGRVNLGTVLGRGPQDQGSPPGRSRVPGATLDSQHPRPEALLQDTSADHTPADVGQPAGLRSPTAGTAARAGPAAGPPPLTGQAVASAPTATAAKRAPPHFRFRSAAPFGVTTPPGRDTAPLL